MIQILEREQLELRQIDDEFKNGFERRTGCTSLTQFESFFLQVVGNLLRPIDSQYFWLNNSFGWWKREYDKNGDPIKDHEFSVWLDKYGNCMYEDHDENKLYRVNF